MGETYTCSIWTVNQGEEDSFIEAFRRFADGATEDFGAREGMILQDTDDATRFVVIRRWDKAESPMRWAAADDSRVLGEPVRAAVTRDADAYVTTKVANLG